MWSGQDSNNKLGGTKITISKLLPEVLEVLQDPVKLSELRTHITSMYHFHLVRSWRHLFRHAPEQAAPK